MAQGQPLGQADSRMFGHAIGCGADLVEKPCRGRRVQEITTTAGGHAWDEVACGPDMGHGVDVPDLLPTVIRDLGSASDRDAGIGTEKIDGAVIGLDLFNQVFDVGL